MPAPAEWLPFLRASYQANRFTNFGPANRLLEERLTERFGMRGRTLVLASSATSGLAAMLLALGVRGRVAIPAFTFPATLRAVEMAGCTPVVCDVDQVTWEMTPATLEQALAAGRVDAVMPVRAFGLGRDHAALARRCEEAGIAMIVDAAAGFGGKLASGEWLGGQGTAEVFSFHATKVFGIGEGGAIALDEALADDVRSALNFGIGPKAIGRGLNGKLNEFAAAVGLAMLERFAELVARRREVAARYLEELEQSGVTLPACFGDPVWQCFPVLLPEHADAEDFVRRARERDIELRRYYHPALTASGAASLETSLRLAAKMVCLPVYSDMSGAEQDEVIACVEEILKRP